MKYIIKIKSGHYWSKELDCCVPLFEATRFDSHEEANEYAFLLARCGSEYKNISTIPIGE